jgi:hypothetical protein
MSTHSTLINIKNILNAGIKLASYKINYTGVLILGLFQVAVYTSVKRPPSLLYNRYRGKAAGAWR